MQPINEPNKITGNDIRVINQETARRRLIINTWRALCEESYQNLGTLIDKIPDKKFKVHLMSDNTDKEENVGTFTVTSIREGSREPSTNDIKKVQEKSGSGKGIEEIIGEVFRKNSSSGIVGDLILPRSNKFPNGATIKDVVILKTMNNTEFYQAVKKNGGRLFDSLPEETTLRRSSEVAQFLQEIDPELRFNLIPTTPLAEQADIPYGSVANAMKIFAEKTKVAEITPEKIVSYVKNLSDSSFSKTTKVHGVKIGDKFEIACSNGILGEMEVVEIKPGSCDFSEIKIYPTNVTREDVINSLVEEAKERALTEDEMSGVAITKTVFNFARAIIATKIGFKITFGENSPYKGATSTIEIPVANCGKNLPENISRSGTIDFIDFKGGPDMLNKHFNYLIKTDFVLKRKI